MNTTLTFSQKINKNLISGNISLYNLKNEEQIPIFDKNNNVFIKNKNGIKNKQSNEKTNKIIDLNKKCWIQNKYSAISKNKNIEKNNFLLNKFIKWNNSGKNQSNTKTNKNQHKKKVYNNIIKETFDTTKKYFENPKKYSINEKKSENNIIFKNNEVLDIQLKENKNFLEKNEINKIRGNYNKSNIYIINIKILVLFLYIVIKSNLFIMVNAESRIKIKLSGTGNLAIYSQEFKIFPNKTKINGGMETDDISYTQNFTGENNTVELIYYNNLNNLSYMFRRCENIVEIDFSEFNSSNVKDIQFMFSGCKRLKSLILSNFDTSKVIIMSDLFRDCSSLVSIDLSSFNTEKVRRMTSMFDGCINLISLNLSNFNITNVKRTGRMFKNCLKLTSLDLSNFKSENLQSNLDKPYSWISEMFYNCTSLTFINLENFDLNEEYTNRSVFHNTPDDIIVCSQDDKWKIILNGTEISINCNIEKKQYKCFIKNTLKILNNNNICNLCNNNDFKVYNYSIIDYSYINCLQINLSNTLNTLGIESFTTEITEEISHEKTRQKVLKEFNNTIILEGNDIKVEIESEGIDIIWTSTKNQINDINKNKTTINLGNCENILKLENNIPLNDSLYILKLEKKEDGLKIPIIEYEIFYLFNEKEMKQLYLDKCKNEKIDISIPVNINNDNIDIYNKSSSYYNDLCSITYSKSKVDITIKDRQNEFINNNMTLCEDNCDLIRYILY